MKIMSGFFALMISSTLIGDFSSAQAAEVCYVPVRGTAMTVCTPEIDADGNLLHPCPEMLGQYRLVLRTTTADPVRQRLRISGPLHGVVNPDQTLNHVLGDNQANGLLYSFGDSLVDSKPLNECQLEVTEELYIKFGTGMYSGAHGTITISGELNICTGVNEFEMVRTGDKLCFDESLLGQGTN